MYNILKQQKTAIIIILSLILSIAISEINSFFASCSDINNTVFRLHIMANSDSDYDQNLKLLVRDEILELDNNIFSTINIDNNLDLIKNTAENVLIENNCNLPVNVEITNMYFNTRYYENFTMPAGYYDALRITIGEAIGENWWCVLYPPLCLPAVQEDDVTQIVSNTLTNEQIDIIENGDKYEFKFALLELYSSLKDKFN